MPEAFVIDGVRTAIGRYGGSLAQTRPDDLAALVVREAVRRAGVDPELIDEVVLGAANQAGEDNRNVARMAVLLQLDGFALQSHERALDAIKNGRFEDEVIPVAVKDGDFKDGRFAVDEGPRADTSLDLLGSLRPINGVDGLVTAGNSSSLNDGAAAVVVASDRFIEKHGLRAQARLVASASVGVQPAMMGIGLIPATRKVLDRAGWSTDDLEVIELNEAFASQSIACIKALGLDETRVNADGGAIALGHPLGCSGTRLVVTLLGRLERADARRALATMCVGVGQGVALLLERP